MLFSIEKGRFILMVGTFAQGGVSTVVRELLGSELGAKWDIRFVQSHADVSAIRKLLLALKAALIVWWACLLRRPALVHIHLSSRASFWRKALIALAPMSLRVRYILHLHSGEFPDFFATECGSLSRACIRFVMNRSCCLVVLSKKWADWAEQTFPSVTVRAIHNSVALPPDHVKQGGAPLVILFMGRLGTRKGTYDLLKAFSRVANLPCSPRLVLAGDGDLAGSRSLAVQLGVSEQVEIPGWISGEERWELYRSAAIYVLPSYHEGLPMSVLEAMSFGLPVLSTPVGGIPDILDHGENGFLAEPGDIDQIAALLSRLLTDEGLRMEMGRAARGKVMAEFATPVIAGDWSRLYSHLCDA